MTTELNDSMPVSGSETPDSEINNGPRPASPEFDRMQVEAQIERDNELINYESKRLAANLKLTIAKNMSNVVFASQIEMEIKEMEAYLAEDVRNSKERVLNYVNTIFEHFENAIKTNLDQSFSQRIGYISKAEMIYLAHMMDKDVVEDVVGSSANMSSRLIIPLSVNSLGVTVFLSFGNDALWIEAKRF